LRRRLNIKILFFNVESLAELKNINRIAQKLNRMVNVAIRINPDVEPKTHKYITTGKITNKFGIDFKNARKILFLRRDFSHLMLSGEMVNDVSMAGTSMLTNISHREYSEDIFDKIGFPQEKMGLTAECGSIIGTVTGKASLETSIPKGIPVVATGHDTQFAIFGSGAEVNQPVLSSGTWEILMVRTGNFKSEKEQLEAGITTELDSRPGLYNIGNQWIASGILEWAKGIWFSASEVFVIPSYAT
jgi:sugar (pentulose or hexulose) kinase